MIVPRSRLLFWVAAVAAPAALVASLVPGAIVVCLLVISGLMAVVTTDAIIAPKRLAGIAIELPAVVRLSKDREGRFDVRIRSDRSHKQPLRLALDMPAEIPAPTEEMDVLL